jgi:YHS domain-containing protein
MNVLDRIVRTGALLAALGLSTLLIQAADKASAKAPKPYPLDTCVVSGEKLGGMGEPYVFVHEGREIKMCCKGCKKDFDKSAAKYVAQIDEAAKKVKAYPLKTCLVSGEPIKDDAPVMIRGGQEYRFCCKNCVKKFEKDPATYTAKLEKK